jgi:hypothetical protein
MVRTAANSIISPGAMAAAAALPVGMKGEPLGRVSAALAVANSPSAKAARAGRRRRSAAGMLGETMAPARGYVKRALPSGSGYFSNLRAASISALPWMFGCCWV